MAEQTEYDSDIGSNFRLQILSYYWNCLLFHNIAISTARF